MEKNYNHLPQDKTLKVVIFAALGSGMEYYDFVIYGMMAKYLSVVFFPSEEGATSLMQIFAIFTVGYIARPLGGLTIGALADNYGRKKAFLITTFAMAFSTLFIGLIPSYTQIGLLAPLLLVICRIFQGISFGAELPGATTIVSEFSKKNSTGKYCSIVLSSTSVGSFCAVMVLSLLTAFFTSDQIIENQIWRIPFLIGGLLAVMSYYIRQNITETPEFVEQQNTRKFEKTRIFRELKRNIINLIVGFCLTFYLSTLIIINIYFPTFINKYFKYSLAQIYEAMSISMIFSFAFMLLSGFISDFVSKIKMMLFTLMASFCIIPFMYVLLERSSYSSLVIFFITYQLLISMYFTSYLPVLSRSFPTEIRYTATALIYNLAFSVASSIPSICSYLYSDSNSPYFLGYFFIFAIVTALIPTLLLFIKKRDQYAY